MDPRKFLAIFLGSHLLLSTVVSTPPTAVDLWSSGELRLALVWLAFVILCAVGSRDRAAAGGGKSLFWSWDRWARWGEGTAFFLSLFVMMQIYMTLKIAIPHHVAFYADPYFAKADAALFGIDPWKITHGLLDEGATRLLDRFYVLPCAAVTFAMTVWACYSSDRAFSRRAVLAICLCWILLGNWAALLLSSAGPVYYEHFYGVPRFRELVAALPPDLIAVRTQAYLLENFGEPGFGKGISAMPSMHNALYLLLIWMIHDRFGNSWQLWLAILFEAVVFVASIHLGWHYAFDGIVAALLVPAVWFAAKWVERLPELRLGVGMPTKVAFQKVLH